MNPRVLLPHGSFLLVMLVLGVVSTGCPSSGLDPYDKKDEDENHEEVDPPAPTQDPPHIENCPTLCAEAMSIYAPLGCDVECDIDLGTTVEAEVDVAIVNLLTLVWVDASGSYVTGETCDLVVRCPEFTPCQSLAITCLNDSSNTPEHCIEQYVECEQEMLCGEIHQDCATKAWEAYEACTDTVEVCQELLRNLNQMCSEEYGECLDVADDIAPLPALPRKTSPGRWDVPRSFLTYHLRRLETLAAETFTMLVPGPDGKPSGLAVFSLEPGDPLVQLGLEEGDIVTAVQGTPISSFASKLTVLLELARKPGVEITLLRKGAAKTFKYRWVD